ncbi:MAG: hypothetical protein ACRCRW_13055 [Aeromonadaceae bacterium]
MEEHDVIRPEAQHKVVWLVKGIALRDITLQAVKLEQAHLAHHLVSWHQGQTPANIPWIVARAKSDKVKIAAEAPPQPDSILAPDAHKHVQWRNQSPRVKISWQTIHSDKEWPHSEPATLTMLVPRRVSWHSDHPHINVSWVK